MTRGEMRLDSLHPGATVEAVRDTIGWDVAVAPDLAETPGPDRRRAAADPRGARSGRRLHEVGVAALARSQRTASLSRPDSTSPVKKFWMPPTWM